MAKIIEFPLQRVKGRKPKAVKPKPKRVVGFGLYIPAVDDPGQERGMLHGFFCGHGYRSLTQGLYTSLFRDGGYFKVYCDKEVAAFLMEKVRERFGYMEVRRLVSSRAA